MERISPITQKVQMRIAEQKEHIKKIEELCNRISEYQKSGLSKYTPFCLAADDRDIVVQALACHMSVIILDAQRQEKAIENGSEGGDLRSHDEKHILQGCLTLLYETVEYFREYLEFVGFEPETEEEELHLNMSYGHIVKTLFLWYTRHSGGTSTAAKCRELGVDYSHYVDLCEWHEED